MNPVILFFILLVLAAAAMLRLSDRALVRLLGVATVLLAVPAVTLLTVLNWRVEFGQQPTVLGYILVAAAAVGAIFLAAGLTTTVLRLVFSKKVGVKGV
jgi:hypothetical protein